MYKPYVINATLNITPNVIVVNLGKIRTHNPNIVSNKPSIKIKFKKRFSDIYFLLLFCRIYANNTFFISPLDKKMYYYKKNLKYNLHNYKKYCKLMLRNVTEFILKYAIIKTP